MGINSKRLFHATSPPPVSDPASSPYYSAISTDALCLSLDSRMKANPSLLKTLLNLTGCVIGVAGSICYEVSTYWVKSAFALLIRNNYEATAWKKQIENAETYSEWLEAAQQLDKVKGFGEWKEDPESNLYDYELIQSRVEQFRVARERNDLEAISFLLRASMSRRFGDIGNLDLYSQSYVGTKRLIEEFIEEEVLGLEFMYQHMPEDNRVARRSKFDFFRGLRHMLGNTALLLSGGGALGIQHVGVLKSLSESGLLPRIISGSSSGAIMASMLCTRDDAELPGLLELNMVNMNFLGNHLQEDQAIGSIWGPFRLLRKLRRILREGVILDQGVLERCLRENLGHMTFLEAYKKSRRVLNVAVSSATQYELPRMLNYLTAPNVLIWSAVVASCAVPGMFGSSALLAKDPSTGALIPWYFRGDEEVRWIDGSVENDIPRARLAELFNVNHFIVSQVNPHVYPFLDRRGIAEGGRRSRGFIRTFLLLLHSEICFRLRQLIGLGIFFPRALHRLLAILEQVYDGDITIVPKITWSDLRTMFVDPSPEQLKSSTRRGEQATWPLQSVIWNQCRVEILLDEILSRMKRNPRVNNGGHRAVPAGTGNGSSGSCCLNSLSVVKDDHEPGVMKSHFRRSSSPLVYRVLEASGSIDDFSSLKSDRSE